VKLGVAVEKGIKAVISVNFSVCGQRKFNNLRTSFLLEFPEKEFFNSHGIYRQQRPKQYRVAHEGL